MKEQQMKTYFQLLLCIREATAAPVASVSPAKQSWERMRQELGRKPTYGDIGHIEVERRHYPIFGLKKRLVVPHELWWTDDGSTINRKKPLKRGDFMIHGRAGTRSDIGGVFDLVGMGGEKSRYKGRIDHERKAIGIVLGDGVDYNSILRVRALEKGVGSIISKMKRLHPDYGVYYWGQDGKVQSA
jgi:hypothetical protein